MHKLIIVLVIVAIMTDGRSMQRKSNGYEKEQILSVVTVDNGIVMGNTLPRTGVLCEDAPVYGNPHDGFPVEYILSKGETVRLREQSHGADRSWVMIKPSYWIRLSALCTK